MQDANAVIDHLAAKLQVPVSHLWDVLVRQAYINFGEWLLFAAVLAVAIRWGWKRYERPDNDMSYEVDDFVGATLCLIAAIASTIATIGTISALGDAFNPEYYALQQVLKALGGR